MVGDDGSPLRMIGTSVDITERKNNEETLRKGEERLRLFTTHANDYVYDASLVGELALPEIVAGSFERTTGMTVQDVIDRGGWAQVVHPEDRERSMALLGELARGRSILNEYRIIDGHGRTRWLRDRLVPVFNDEGGLYRLVGGVTDITEQRALEEQLVEAQRMEALARMAAGVAHDFNNLLTVLMAEVSLLQRPEVADQDRTRSFSAIDATLERAAHLTSSLLAFGRKNIGPARVIDLAAAVINAEPMLSRAASARVQVKLEVTNNQVKVVADPNDIQLVLLNLTLNARDAMPKGGALTIALEAITLTAADVSRPAELLAGPYARLWVRDEGEGIASGQSSRIFEPYFTTKGHGGTGLGLPTCLGIVKRYGGLLRLCETSQEGTLFEILLPISADPLFSRAPIAPRTMVGGSEHILLVEDDDAVRNVAERVLKERGYKVTSAESAEAALALGDVLATVDVLFTDVRLPGESGLGLAITLRQTLPGMKVLVMSGHVEDPEQQTQLADGRYPFLAKPFTVQGLLLRLREVLDGLSP